MKNTILYCALTLALILQFSCNDSRQKSDEAEKQYKQARAEMSNAVMDCAVSLARKSNEPAADLAVAVLGICSIEIEKFLQSKQRWLSTLPSARYIDPKERRAIDDKNAAEFRLKLYEMVVGTITKARISEAP